MKIARRFLAITLLFTGKLAWADSGPFQFQFLDTNEAGTQFFIGKTLRVQINPPPNEINSPDLVSVEATGSTGNPLLPLTGIGFGLWQFKSPVNEGTVTITVHVRDATGREGEATRTFSVDQIAPTCEYAYPPTPAVNDWVRRGVALNVRSTDNVGVRQAQLTAPLVPGMIGRYQALGGHSWQLSFDTRGIEDSLIGPQAFQTECIDLANNMASAVATSMRIDNGNPQILFSIAPPPIEYSDNGRMKKLIRDHVQITLNASDGAGSGIGTKQLIWDGVSLPISANGFNLDTKQYPDGIHVLHVRVVDNVGNESVMTHNLTIDNSPPDVFIASPQVGLTISGSLENAQLFLTDLNAIKRVNLFIDGEDVPYLQQGISFTFTHPTPVGFHTFSVEVEDHAGNITMGQRRYFVNDYQTNATLFSGIRFLHPVEGDAISIHTWIYMIVGDVNNQPKVSIRVNNGPETIPIRLGASRQVSIELDTTRIPDGPATIEAFVRYSNNSVFSSVLPVVIDNSPPVVDQLFPAKDSNLSGTVLIGGSAHDDSALKRVAVRINSPALYASPKLSGETTAAVSYKWDTTQVPNGTYRLELRIMDQANLGLPRFHNVNVRNTPLVVPPPIVNNLVPFDGAVLSGVVNLKMPVESEITSLAIRVDGNPVFIVSLPPLGIYSAALDTAALSDGFHRIDFSQSNVGGETIKTINVRVDNSPPNLTIEQPTPNQRALNMQNLLVRATDNSNLPLDSIEYHLNTNSLASLPGNPSVAQDRYAYGLDTQLTNARGNPLYPNGDYLLTVVVKDQAGNESQATTPFVIDNTRLPSSARVTWTPSKMFAVGPVETRISALIENASVDPLSVVPTTIRVTATTGGGEIKPVSGTTRLTGNTLDFTGAIPYNGRINCILEARDTDGNIIQATHYFTSGMDKEFGGVVTLGPDHLLELRIPPGALPAHAFVEMSTDLTNNQEILNASEPRADFYRDVVYGPVLISAFDEASQRITIPLRSWAELRFQRPVEQIPPNQQTGYTDEAQMLTTSGLWQSISDGAPALNSAASDPGARAIRAFLTMFGIYRIVSYPAPVGVITEIINYPNPFSSSEGGTKFEYLLAKDSEVQMAIYDLTGRLVRRWDVSRGAPGGKVASNSLTWDGRNGEGRDVANGGYIAVITATDDTGATAQKRRKIAVVK